MADADNEQNDETEETEEGKPAPRKKGKLLVILLLFLLVTAGAGGGLYATGLLDGLLGTADEESKTQDGEEKAEEDKGPRAFHELPEILVNLGAHDGGPGYLKLSITLELEGQQAQADVEEVQPVIIDGFQVYLRELRPEDLEGSIGLQRLREELLSRANLALEDTRVTDVLFRQVLVQ